VTTAAEPDQATEVPETTATWRTQLARLFSEVFAPWVLIIALFLGVGWHAAGPPGLAWGLLGATFASLGPMSAILTGIIVGRFTDHHLTVREHRLPILILSVALVITGIVALAILGAPRDVVAVEAAMLGGLVITLANHGALEGLVSYRSRRGSRGHPRHRLRLPARPYRTDHRHHRLVARTATPSHRHASHRWRTGRSHCRICSVPCRSLTGLMRGFRTRKPTLEVIEDQLGR
jgi:hypothetical protein